MRRLGAAAIVLAVCVAAVPQIHAQTLRIHAPSRASDVQKYAYDLAVIQLGYVDKHDPVVQLFARPLNSLAGKCYADSVERLASYTVKSRQLEGQRGVTESLLSILIHVNKALPFRMRGCSQIFALYVALRTKG